MEDCSHMTGDASCTVSTECTDDLYESSAAGVSDVYPPQPANVRITPIPDGGNPPGQNISWTYETSIAQPQSYAVVSRKMSPLCRLSQRSPLR